MRPVPAAMATAALLGVGAAAGAAVTATPERLIPPAAPRRAPVEVRTQVVHRTVRVVKHVRPRHPPAAAPPAPVAAGAPATSQPAAPTTTPPTSTAPPLRTSSSAPGAAPLAQRPLRTSSSATGASGGEHEHGDGEHGDD